MNSNKKVKRALISVTDKNGIVEFAKALRELSIEIISTGGSAALLKANGIEVTTVEEVTKFPEILGGRVKTLHPHIHGGILADTDKQEHLDELARLGIAPIDMLVVNLYPFENTLSKSNVTHQELIENIDIGGVALLRAAGKNYKSTLTVISPDNYTDVIEMLRNNDLIIDESIRCNYARKVFEHTSHYDSLIADYFAKYNQIEHPDKFCLSHNLEKQLRYGENPHQKADLYGNFTKIFIQLHGKELSYNNILDIDMATRLVAEFERPAATIFKHNNPCGVAIGKDLVTAYRSALNTDPLSAFGGIIALNRKVDLATAQAIDEIFSEVVIAPDFHKDAFEFLTAKKNRILISADLAFIAKLEESDIRTVAGGILVQQQDKILLDDSKTQVVSQRKPSDTELSALMFAWTVSKYVKSNAIVFTSDTKTLAIGAGQMSRIDSCRIAIKKARTVGISLENSVIASDGFFPFPDTLFEASAAGATAAISPGGSIKDAEVIKNSDRLNLAMIFTGIRHFKH